MKRLERALIRLEIQLRQLDVAWALVGGLAVSARSVPRTTQDIDLTISVRDDGEAEALCQRLMHRGFTVFAQLEHLDRKRLATVRFLAPGDGPGTVIDVLFASSGIETEIVEAAERLEVLPGLSVPVATAGHLLALKVLAGRNQDLVDIERLLRFSSDTELQRAREAVRLISSRGYDRGKQLAAELEALVSRS